MSFLSSLFIFWSIIEEKDGVLAAELEPEIKNLGSFSGFEGRAGVCAADEVGKEALSNETETSDVVVELLIPATKVRLSTLAEAEGARGLLSFSSCTEACSSIASGSKGACAAGAGIGAGPGTSTPVRASLSGFKSSTH